VVKHDSVMVEACNASFQVHLQLADPDRFAHLYNLAQLLLAPVLAASTNSPVLFGRRLWAETRIALFEQACDIRTPGMHLRESAGRVSFGREWLRGSVVETSTRRTSRASGPSWAPSWRRTGWPRSTPGACRSMKALRLHNGTIYRWNRACYGISENGKAAPAHRAAGAALGAHHRRRDRQQRVLAGADERARRDHRRHHHAGGFRPRAGQPVRRRARRPRGAADVARRRGGARADAAARPAAAGMARSGLDRAGVDPADSERYLGILERRIRTMHTGSRWTLDSLAGMKDRGTQGARLTALTAAMIARQKTDAVVADWEPARLDENDSARTGYHKVSQYMTTDIFTVRPDDPVELVADLMSWERIRYVPVEDDKGRLVGLVSQRVVLRYLADLSEAVARGRRGEHPGGGHHAPRRCIT
jgi:CBS domain-containing protein